MTKHRIALDANCVICAIMPGAHAHAAMRRILKAYQDGCIALCVSFQTLHELGARPDAALELAHQFEQLPHYSIGSWDEQVGSWNDEDGTYADGEFDDKRQELMATLAKSGNGVRDRGALIDALRSGCHAFVTSDGQLSKSGPAHRLEREFSILIRTPQQYVEEFLP
jgi:hypothetical protein